MRDPLKSVSLASYLGAAVLVLASARGLIVLHSSLPAEAVYNAVAALLVALSIYGCLKSTGEEPAVPNRLRALLVINVALGAVNIAVDLLIGAPVDPGLIWLLMAPYAVFVFLRLPSSVLNAGIVTVGIALSYSVLASFVDTLRGGVGLQHVFEYNMRLRPETFTGLSRTGEFYRPAGFTGSYHDSANILGMVVSYLYVRYLVGGKLLDLGISLLGVLALFVTQSAANVASAVVTCGGFTLYVLARRRRAVSLVYLGIAVAAVTWLLVHYGGAMDIVAKRLAGGGGQWTKMARSLDMGTVLSSVPFFLVGHAGAYGSAIVETEVALLKLLTQFGIIHAIVIFSILLYPVVRYVRARRSCIGAMPAVAAICFGFLSLAHYGSLVRSTNVFLFYALYAICLRELLACSESRSVGATQSAPPPTVRTVWINGAVRLEVPWS